MRAGLALIATLSLTGPAVAQDRLQEVMGACYAPSGDVGQAATALSTIGWRVGGDVERAVEARAMVLPYLSGYSDQDLRRNGVALYLSEGLTAAAEDASVSGFLESPEGHTVMMTHGGDALDCTLVLAPGTLTVSLLDSLPNASDPVFDPQMTVYRFQPTGLSGVTGAEGALWEADGRDYTQVNPPRPRDVDLILTTRVQMQ